jgi:tetratricopeptide (TPR) repeat protein
MSNLRLPHTNAARAQAQADRWQAALETQQRFEGTYGFFKKGDEQAANATVDLIQIENKPLALCEMANAHEDAGQLQTALELRLSVRADNLTPGTSDQNASRMAHLQAQLGDLGGAVKTARTITDPVQQVWAWSQLASIQEASGDKRAAAASLKQATEVLERVDEPNKGWLTANIATAYAQIGDAQTSLDMARNLFSQHGSVHDAIAVFRTLANSTAERDGLEQAQGLVNGLQSPFEKASALVGIAERVFEQ